MADPRPIAELEQRIGHRFTDPVLLERAVTHRSFAHEHPEQAAAGDNEQLEFLGDAVLALVVAEGLLTRFPERSEGELSKARSALCSGPSLAERAREVGLGEHLRLGRGEEKTGGRGKGNVLADAYEAVIGAVFRDGGLEAARDAVLAHLDGEMERVLGSGAPAEVRDFKSELQEVLQQQGGALPRYVTAGEEGPAHERTFRVVVEHDGRPLAEGEGPSKKAAAQAAAQAALRRLAGHDDLHQPREGAAAAESEPARAERRA